MTKRVAAICGVQCRRAFATLVARHVNKVYSVVLRHTGNPRQAEEITQAVFVILARKSRHLERLRNSVAIQSEDFWFGEALAKEHAVGL